MVELEKELTEELRELEEVEDLIDELGGELGEEKTIITLSVDSFGSEDYEISLELDEDPEDMDEEDLELMAEFYGELAEAQELGFIKKLFRKIKKGFKKIWRKKWLRTAVITAGVVGAGALAYKFSPAFRGVIQRGIFKAKQKWWAFRRWTTAQKWRIKRWWRRRRWLSRVRKLQKKEPRSWWSRLKKANRLRIAYKAEARAKKYLSLYRKTGDNRYLNLFKRWQRAYKRLMTPERPEKGSITTFRERIKLQTPQVRANIPRLNIQQQQQAGLQKALMPLLLVGGGLTLLRFMRG